jgi:hypothetical protein
MISSVIEIACKVVAYVSLGLLFAQAWGLYHVDLQGQVNLLESSLFALMVLMTFKK